MCGKGVCNQTITCPTGKVHFKDPRDIPPQKKCGADFNMAAQAASSSLCVCEAGKYRAYYDEVRDSFKILPCN